MKTKFLRRRGTSSNFHFPFVMKDITWVVKDDILAKLLPPSISITARTIGFRFNYDFSGYDDESDFCH